MPTNFELYKDYQIQLSSFFNNLKNNSKQVKYTFDDLFLLAFVELKNKNIGKDIIKQITRNTLSQMYKDNMIMRLKRGLYSFSFEIIDLKIKIDKQEYESLVVRDLYFDYLKEKTNAVPVDNNVYLDLEIFKDINNEVKKLFLELFSQYKILDKKLVLKNESEKFIFQIFSYISNYKLDDDTIKYIKEKLKKLNIDFEMINEFYFKNINSLKKHKIRDKVLKILEGILNDK